MLRDDRVFSSLETNGIFVRLPKAWWTRAIIKGELGDKLIPLVAEVRGKNYSVWVLGISAIAVWA